MNIKKILMTFLVAVMVLMPFSVVNVNAEETNDEATTGEVSSNKVKVYVFVKDGCGYCEAQEQYLEELAKTNDKFQTVILRAYDSNWKPVDYYDLASEVSDYFVNEGFENAAFSGTPLVVISDVYAAAAYSTELEDIINEVYEKGDVDIVGQMAATMGIDLETGEIVDNHDYTGEKVFGTLVFLALAGVIGVSIYSRTKSGPDYEEDARDYGNNDEENHRTVAANKTKATITCKECGYENPSDVSFCNNCGSVLREISKVAKTKTTTKKNTQNNKTNKPNKPKKK